MLDVLHLARGEMSSALKSTTVRTAAPSFPAASFDGAWITSDDDQ